MFDALSSHLKCRKNFFNKLNYQFHKVSRVVEKEENIVRYVIYIANQLFVSIILTKSYFDLLFVTRNGLFWPFICDGPL